MRKLRVNIFDDDIHNLKLLKIFLSRRDYEVMTFDKPVVCPLYDAHQDECLRPCFDIIITDYHMPRMTGVEMLVQQRQRGCKVDRSNKAVMTADPGSIKKEIVEELGCTLFGKPIDSVAFFAWLDDCEKRVDLSTPIAVRRKEDRYPATIDTLFAYNTAEKIYKGIVTDYSANGFCLKAYAPFIEEQSIVIKTELPNGCRNASVRWVKPMEAGCHMAGLMAE